MRKFFALFCMMTALTMFVGCGETDNTAPVTTEEETTVEETDTLDPPADGTTTEDPATDATNP